MNECPCAVPKFFPILLVRGISEHCHSCFWQILLSLALVHMLYENRNRDLLTVLSVVLWDIRVPYLRVLYLSVDLQCLCPDSDDGVIFLSNV